MKHRTNHNSSHRMTRRLRLAVLPAACVASASLVSNVLAQGDVHYRVVPLPLPDGTTSISATDLNNSNQVSGSAYANSGLRPVLYSDGTTMVLDQVDGTQTTGAGVSDRGYVVGWMYEWGVIRPSAFLWDGKQNHWILDSNQSMSYAEGVNERNQVVGFYYPPGGHANGNAFVYNKGEYYDLGPGEATDINNSGIIVGQNNRYFGDTSIWEPDGQSGWTQTILDGQIASAINESGTVFCGAGPFVGCFLSAVVWNKVDGHWVRSDIGNWDPNQEFSMSNDVNDLGQVVGDHESFTEPNKGWLYQDGKVVYLNDLLAPGEKRWSIATALRINESSVILAEAQTDGQRTTQPVLLIPDTLTILGPRGNGAGSTNELIAVSAIPGDRIYFAVGFATGSQQVPGCPGVHLGLAAPRVVGSAVANADREARIFVFVPASGAGRTVYLQAIDRSHCDVSNVVRYTFH